jgi:hypothetical protein
MIKSGQMIAWTGHTSHKGKKIKAYRIMVGKT